MLLKKISIILILGLTVFGYQNCSESEFSKLDSSSKLLGDGGLNPDLTEEEAVEEIKKEVEVIVEEEEKKKKKKDAKKDDEQKDDDDEEEVVVKDDDSENKGKTCEANDLNKYIRVCEALRSSDMQSEGDVDEIKNHRLISRHVVSSVGEIKNFRGAMLLLGDKEGSAVDSIKNVMKHSLIIACDMDIKMVQNIGHGAIVITVNGDIVKARNNHGNLASIGGDIGAVENNHGRIFELGSLLELQNKSFEDGKACGKAKKKQARRPATKKKKKKKHGSCALRDRNKRSKKSDKKS